MAIEEETMIGMTMIGVIEDILDTLEIVVVLVFV
jgi:hypothetical protein